MTVTSPTELPNAQTLKDIAKVEVWDDEGKKIPFGTLYRDQKTVVVFIRTFLLRCWSEERVKMLIRCWCGMDAGHFFCGVRTIYVILSV